MSAHDIDAVMTKIGKSKQCECGSGATADAIEHAQRALGNTFPDDYSAFLQRFGWAVVKECDVFGLGDGIPSYMDVVLTTKSERTEMEPRLLARYVALMNDGAGNHYCLDCDKLSAGQCPVVLWEHDADDGERQRPMRISDTFAEWLAGVLRHGMGH